MIRELIKSVFSHPTNEQVLHKYRGLGLNPRVETLGYKDHSFRYLVLNDNKDLPTLFFIHGAPGHLLCLENYFTADKIHQHSRIIAVERPGYGLSSLGRPIEEIAEQAKAFSMIIEKEVSGPCCLVAHSFGGPVACKLAIDQPEKIDQLILLAPALDPDHEKILKIAYLTKIPLLRHLVPTHLQSAGKEKFTHKRELELLKPHLTKLKVPLIHFHGTNDKIVPYENLLFAKNYLNNPANEFITLPGDNHYINYSVKNEIVNAIKRWLTQQ